VYNASAEKPKYASAYEAAKEAGIEVLNSRIRPPSPAPSPSAYRPASPALIYNAGAERPLSASAAAHAAAVSVSQSRVPLGGRSASSPTRAALATSALRDAVEGSGAGVAPALDEIVAITGGRGPFASRLEALGRIKEEQYAGLGRSLLTMGVMPALVRAIETHQSDPVVVQSAVVALRNITSTADDVAAASLETGAVSALTTVLVSHAADSFVVEGACGALLNIAGGVPPGAPAVMAGAQFERAIPHLVEATQHPGARKHAARLLERLGRDTNGSFLPSVPSRATAPLARRGDKECSIV
jgi:hypothetical protein